VGVGAGLLAWSATSGRVDPFRKAAAQWVDAIT
jgi:hypothetical protein